MRRRFASRRSARALIGTFAAAAPLGIAGLVAVSPSGAATPVTLYVSAAGTKTAGCAGPGATACKTIQEAVNAADTATHAGDAVTVTVAAGSYTGIGNVNVNINATALSSLTVQGAGAASTKVTGANASEDFTVSRGTVDLRDLAIDDGSATAGGGVYVGHATVTLADDTFADDSAHVGTTTTGGSTTTGRGGGMYSAGGTVTLTNDTFTNDTASDGGGMYTAGGTVTLKNDTFTNDTASGGGGGGFVMTTGVASLTDDTFSTDKARDGGGALFYASGATLTDDTFSHDTAFTGGGIYSESSETTVVDSTFATDKAKHGAGAYFDAAGATLTYDTFSQDTASVVGGAIYSTANSTTVNASVFDASTCTRSSGSFTGGYDVTTTSTCDIGTSSVKSTAGDLGLTTTLEPNTSTGPETLALRAGSPAVDEVPASSCSVTVGATKVAADERGFPRPGDAGQSACDAGAYELQSSATAVDCPTGASACASAAPRPGRLTSVSSGDVRVTASGRGTLTVGTFRSDPAGPLQGSTARFFGVYVSSQNRFTSVVVKDCDVGAGTSLEWWNGRAWLAAGPEQASSGCLTLTLGATSNPSLGTAARIGRLSRLGGVVFADARAS